MNYYKEMLISMLENKLGEYISGREIAEKLNISRNMVWKYVKQLEKEGNIINSSRKGYCLVSQNTAFSSHKIKKYLKYTDFEIEIFDTVVSTNTLLREMAEKGKNEKTVVISAHQTGGKGRMGRNFYSPLGSGIYMSLLLRPDLYVKDSILVTTCAAVSVCRAIEKVCNKKTDIKWVNDIYIDNKKICGILTEASINLESGKPEYIVLGIGLNLDRPDNDFPDDIKNIAGALFENIKEAENLKNMLVAEIINCFYEEYEHITEKRFYSEYVSRMFLIGKKVKVLSQKEYVADVIGLDEDFSLVVKDVDGKTFKLNSGEVSTSLY